MDAWLKTHIALVSPIANAIYMAGGDNYQLARDRSGVTLMLRAIREGFGVLRVVGVPITPFGFRFLEWIPEILLVPCLQRMLNTTWAELAITQHANAARDEMKQLADEFRTLAQAASVPAPAIDRLSIYLS
jgi:2-dehydropantoate 2-reductase